NANGFAVNGLVDLPASRSEALALDATVPMSAPAGGAGAASGKRLGDKESNALAMPALRTKFADTAFWTPAVVTDSKGAANVHVIWPDNLTQWRAQAVGTTAAAQVGAG